MFKYQVSLWETPLDVFFSVVQRYDKKFISKIEKYDTGIEFNYSVLIYFQGCKDQLQLIALTLQEINKFLFGVPGIF